jgi:hypothetical protein
MKFQEIKKTKEKLAQVTTNKASSSSQTQEGEKSMNGSLGEGKPQAVPQLNFAY